MYVKETMFQIFLRQTLIEDSFYLWNTVLYDHPMQIDLYGHPSMCKELCACIAHWLAWRAKKKCTSRLEGNYDDSNCMNLNRIS